MTTHTTAAASTRESTAEGRALLAALPGIAAHAPTACAGWTAHDVLAHLAAGAKERADLIEEKLAGRPDRPTRPFDEREAEFTSMPDERLRDALVRERARAQAAVGALERRHGTVSFTGRPFTAAQLTTHVRSEAALHRWDLVGDDAVGDGLLAQPELTRHAVEILDTLPVLTETPRSRARLADVSGLRIVLRAPGQPDVVFVADTDDGTCELVTDGPCRGDVVLTCEPAVRLLTLWGRWPGRRPIVVEAGHPRDWQDAAAVLWPAVPAAAR